MSKSLGHFFVVVIGCAAVALFFADRGSGAGGGKDKSTTQDKKTGKDTGKSKEKIDPEKLKPDLAAVKVQKEKAGRYYKGVVEADKVPSFESAHFCVYGEAGDKKLDAIAVDLERAYLKATKILELPKDPGPWPGKLSVFLLTQGRQYGALVRTTQRRKADEGEFGCFDDETDFPHVIAFAAKLPGELAVDGTACTFMGAYLAQARAQAKLPEWVSEGFGRATTLYVRGTAALTLDRRRVAVLLAGKNPPTIGNINGNNVKQEEMGCLRASAMDYLAYSGRTTKLIPFLEGFREIKGAAGNFNTALANAKLTEQDFTKVWQAYAKSVK